MATQNASGNARIVLTTTATEIADFHRFLHNGHWRKSEKRRGCIRAQGSLMRTGLFGHLQKSNVSLTNQPLALAQDHV